MEVEGIMCTSPRKLARIVNFAFSPSCFTPSFSGDHLGMLAPTAGLLSLGSLPLCHLGKCIFSKSFAVSD